MGQNKIKQVIFIVYLCFFSLPANAYVDPGTGGLIIQAIAAGLAAVGVFWTSLKLKIFNKKKDEDKTKEINSKEKEENTPQ